MMFKDNYGKYKVRCAICRGFYFPKTLSDEKFLVCYICKESTDENVKNEIKKHAYEIKSGENK